MSKNILTQKRLKEVLHYNPDTGVFTQKLKTSQRVNIGDTAGYIDRSTGYIRISIDSIKHGAHRLAILYIEGVMPKVVDHDNKIKTDNEYSNLKNTTQAVNCKNKSLSKKNKTGIHGVNFICGKFESRISVNNKPKYLGRFSDFFEACCIRKSAELEHGYSMNHGR